MLLVNVFLTAVVFAFERGNYNEGLKQWIRLDEDSESPFADFANCFYFVIVTGTTLGYGDMSPRSHGGKLTALLTVALGLVNITFEINTIGDCLEEIFRRYLEDKSKKIEEQRTSCIYRTANPEAQKKDSIPKKTKTTVVTVKCK